MKKSDHIFKPISLLPPEYKKEISVLILMKYIVLVTGIILVLTSMLYIATPYLFWSKNQALTEVVGNIDTINNEISNMQKFEVVYNKEQKFGGILNQAMGKIPDWDVILTAIYISKPLGITIKSTTSNKITINPITPTSSPSTGQPIITSNTSDFLLVLNGSCVNISDLSFWISQLKEQKIFSNIELGSVASNEDGYSYQLTLKITNVLPFDYKKGVKLDDKNEEK